MPEGNFFHYDQAAVDHLARKDKKLAAAMQAIGPVRREVMPDLFQALMHAITGQQISMAAQRTVWGRLCGLLGEVTPQALLAQPQTALQALGLSARKVDYMRGIARQVVDGELDLPGMAALEDAEVCRRLAALRGIGVWTAEMLLLFSLQRSDILSYDDLPSGAACACSTATKRCRASASRGTAGASRLMVRWPRCICGPSPAGHCRSWTIRRSAKRGDPALPRASKAR